MTTSNEKKEYARTYSVLVENEPGVLNRVSGLFSARGFNILSLAVGETLDPTMSRMTIVVLGTSQVLEQVQKQLNKLIPVISVLPMSDEEKIAEELVLIKLNTSDDLIKYVEESAKEGKSIALVDSGEKCTVIRIIAKFSQEDEIFKQLEKFGIQEICRTGEIALSKNRTFNFVAKNSN